MKNSLARIVLWALFLIHVSGTAGIVRGEEARIMKFVTSPPLETNLVNLSTLVLAEAFKRLGYGYEVEQVPQLRAISMMQNGIADGDATRVEGFNRQHPYYILVNEHHTVVYTSAFAVDPDIKVTSWNDLKTGNYRVGYLLGVELAERNLIGLIDKRKLIAQPVSNTNGLSQLNAGRFDVYVYVNSEQAKKDLATEYFENSRIIMVGHLDEIKVYPYLQKKHEALADVLAEQIREIKAEGLLDKFEQQLGVTQ